MENYISLLESAEKMHLQEKQTVIYFLMDGEKVVYVGSTENLNSAVHSHRMDKRKKFDSVLYKSVPPSEKDMIRLMEISKHSPKYNGISVPSSLGLVSIKSFRLKFQNRPGTIELRKAIVENNLSGIIVMGSVFYNEADLKAAYEKHTGKELTYLGAKK